MYDFHIHSTFSDGRFMDGMVRAAEEAGLDGVGFADHCHVCHRAFQPNPQGVMGMNLDLTYERRREGIEHLRGQHDIEIYDCVEMNYDPRDEDLVREFLDEADFEYTMGSVHFIDDLNVQRNALWEDRPRAERASVVDTYYDNCVALVESDLFDVVAHIDLIERTPALRGFSTEAHYQSVASALAGTGTMTEINAGRALGDPALVHPSSTFLEILLDHDVPITVGSDSHHPHQLGERMDFLQEFAEEWEIDYASPLE